MEKNTKLLLPRLILPSNDVTLCNYSKLNNLCKPLLKYDITFFNYLKVNNQGKITDLNNAPDMTEHFYYKSNLYQQFIPIINSLSVKEAIVMDKTLPEQDFFYLMQNKFNIDNVIFFIVKQPNCTTFWQFGSTTGNKKIVNFYLNNINILKNFIKYFLLSAQDILWESEINAYQLVFDKENEQKLSENYLGIYSVTDIKKTLTELSVNKNKLQATLRELECLRCIARGKTLEETGDILNISKRTVETHINNLKIKWNCTKTTQLIVTGIKLSLL